LIEKNFSVSTDKGFFVTVKKEGYIYQVTLEKDDFQCALFLKSSDGIKQEYPDHEFEDEPVLLARFNSRIRQDDPAFEIYLEKVDEVRREVYYRSEVLDV
jgi:hypothetical protein